MHPRSHYDFAEYYSKKIDRLIVMKLKKKSWPLLKASISKLCSLTVLGNAELTQCNVTDRIHWLPVTLCRPRLFVVNYCTWLLLLSFSFGYLNQLFTPGNTFTKFNRKDGFEKNDFHQNCGKESSMMPTCLTFAPFSNGNQ